MRHLPYIGILILITSCTGNSDKPLVLTHNSTSVKLSDTVYKNPGIINKLTVYFDGDTIVTGFKKLDSLIYAARSDPKAKNKTNINYCWGDCCGYYSQYEQTEFKTKLILFKGDCGDHGFSNNQYYFERDRLKFVHDYEYAAGTDTSTLTEKFYYFGPGEVILKQRRISSRNYLQEFTDHPFTTVILNKEQVSAEKLKDLQSLLDLQKISLNNNN
jgi:hypothetical protein